MAALNPGDRINRLADVGPTASALLLSHDSVPVIAGWLRQMADAYPHLTEATVQAMADGWDYAEQFQFGLDLILDALAGQRDSS